MIWLFFVLSLAPMEAAPKESFTASMVIPLPGNQTMIVPRGTPDPSGASSPERTRFRVPRNGNEWLALGIVLIGFLVLVLVIILVVRWLLRDL